MILSYIKEIKLQKRKMISSTFVILFSWMLFFIFSRDEMKNITAEDGIIESLTAFFLFIASVTFFLSNKKHNIFIYALAFILFFGAGEEISWGQRIFNIQTPDEMKKVNVQGEITLHNLEIFNRTNFDNTYKSGLKNLLTMDVLFRIFSFSFGILLPFLVFHINFIKKITMKLKIPVPPISIGIFFLLTYICLRSILIVVGTDMDTKLATPEVFEFTASYIWFMIGTYFYAFRNSIIMGKDVKHSFN